MPHMHDGGEAAWKTGLSGLPASALVFVVTPQVLERFIWGKGVDKWGLLM